MGRESQLGRNWRIDFLFIERFSSRPKLGTGSKYCAFCGAPFFAHLAWVVCCHALSGICAWPADFDSFRKQYFLSAETRDYFLTLKLTKARFFLPGVFDGNPHQRSVNGALWTIPLEVRWYAILCLLGLLGVLKRRWLLLAGLLIFACDVFGFHHAEHNPNRVFNQEFGLFFMYGVCMHVFRSVWESKPLFIGAALCAFSAAFGGLGHPYIALFIALPYGVILCGAASTPVIRRFGRFGDLSYGVYIYAFPVQQTMVWLTGNKISFINGLSMAIICTTVLALASWHWVERPMLSLKRRLQPRKPEVKH